MCVAVGRPFDGLLSAHSRTLRGRDAHACDGQDPSAVALLRQPPDRRRTGHRGPRCQSQARQAPYAAHGYECPVSKALKALEKRQLYFAGPLTLKQGGRAVVGRLPIFRENNFLGFSVVLVKLSTLLAAAGIDSLQNRNFIYQLSKVNPSTGKEQFFLPATIPHEKTHVAIVEVPDGEWKLYVMQKK